MSAAAAAASTPSAAPSLLDRASPEDAKLLEAFAEASTIGRGWAVSSSPKGDRTTVLYLQQQRDLNANAQRKSLGSLSVPLDASSPTLSSPFPMELKGVALVAPSPSGRRLLLVRQVPKGEPGAGSTVLEIWSSGRLLKEYKVPLAVHGSVYAEGFFGASSRGLPPTRFGGGTVVPSPPLFAAWYDLSPLVYPSMANLTSSAPPPPPSPPSLQRACRGPRTRPASRTWPRRLSLTARRCGGPRRRPRPRARGGAAAAATAR